jgi:protein CpxP
MKAATKTSIIALTCLGLTFAVTTGACGRHHPGPEVDINKVKKFATFKLDDKLDDLKATDEQRKQLHAIKDRVIDTIWASRDEHKQAKQIFLAELAKDQPDPDKLHRLLDERIDALKPKLHEGLDTLLEVHATLTPEQRGLIKEKIQEHHKARGCFGH